MPFGVSLGNISEPMGDVEVRLYIDENCGITYNVIQDSITISRPARRMLSFRIHVKYRR